MSNSKQESYRFSGHDTFHCKEQWLLKGVQTAEKEGYEYLRDMKAIADLGVGKNMVRSIQHWLKSFNIINDKNQLTEFSRFIFTDKSFDPYLEYNGSLWLLQYQLCKRKYASIFKIIFGEYFMDKAVFEFSEYQIFRYVNSELKRVEHKPITDKTFAGDFKVFIKTYLPQVKSYKTVEDDFNVPLVSLNLIEDTGRFNDKTQKIYRLNADAHDVPIEILAYCILDYFEDEIAISFENISNTIGSFLCLTNDKLDQSLIDLAEQFKEFNYKNDAGIRQIQIKTKYANALKTKILKSYYD